MPRVFFAGVRFDVDVDTGSVCLTLCRGPIMIWLSNVSTAGDSTSSIAMTDAVTVAVAVARLLMPVLVLVLV